MPQNDLQTEINKIIELTLGLRDVQTDLSLIEHYGAESVDIANIAAALEKKYAVHIPESDLPNLRTSRDFFHLVQSFRSPA